MKTLNVYLQKRPVQKYAGYDAVAMDLKTKSLIAAAPVLQQACRDGLKFLNSLPETGNTLQIENLEAYRNILRSVITLSEDGKV